MKTRWLIAAPVLLLVLAGGLATYVALPEQPFSPAKTDPSRRAQPASPDESNSGQYAPASVLILDSPQRTIAAETGMPSAAPLAAPVPLPLVATAPDAGMKLNAEQLSAMDALWQDFAAAVGGAGQNPNDPNYRARWQAARPRADEQLRRILGQQAFARHQRNAMQQEAARDSSETPVP